jgi:zeaxanthin glucosyltransferase
MSRLGFLCFPGSGHLNPLIALGRRLQGRGHDVTFFQITDAESAIRAAGLNFVQIGRRQFPRGTLARLDQKLGSLSGFEAVRFTGRRICAFAAMVLEEAPREIRDARVDALVVDQAELGGRTVTDLLKLPFVSVAAAMPIYLEPDFPFFAFHWRPGASPLHKFRNRLGNLFIEHLAGRGRAMVNRYRHRWHLPSIRRINEFSSPLALISQVPAEFDSATSAPILVSLHRSVYGLAES